MIIEAPCQKCKKKLKLTVQLADYAKWQNGELIQDAFPYLSKDQREILISQLCGECFDKLFKEDDEDVARETLEQKT